MIESSVRQRVEALVGPVATATPVSGGCIATALHVEAGGTSYFLKFGSGRAGATFHAESLGLDALRGSASGEIFVPAVYGAAENSEGTEFGFILMDWIEQGEKNNAFWQKFGQGLAAMHASESPTYGFGSHNFIGSLPQINTWEGDWSVFFRDHRLAPQIERARRSGMWLADWDAIALPLIEGISDMLPPVPQCSLVHGDLWSGNVLAHRDGLPVLIDPAVYYGDREVDVAMTELFGRFPEAFYAAYRDRSPLSADYDKRKTIYNLYHLINHLNHFGSGYASQVGAMLRAVRSSFGF